MVREAIDTVLNYRKEPAYEAPDIPDLRAELHADFDRAVEDEDSATNQFRRLLGT